MRVRDHGVGMTPDLLARAFDLFVQDTRSLDRAQGGIGIGLTMVRSWSSCTADRCGPSATARAMAARSSCASRCAPARADAGRRPKTSRGAAAAPASRRCASWSSTTTSMPRPPSGACSRSSATRSRSPTTVRARWRRPARARPELVCIDIGLPGMDGYELAAALRGAGFEHATLVAVTGYGRDDDLQRSRAGFDHHLVKPVTWRSNASPGGSGRCRTPARRA